MQRLDALVKMTSGLLLGSFFYLSLPLGIFSKYINFLYFENET